MRFLQVDAQAAMVPRNSVVIVRRDGMQRGGELVNVACGKILWSEQVDAQSGHSYVQVVVRGAGDPVQFRMSADEWVGFRPLAVAARQD
ncbi:MAG: hypothetical protein GF320_14695 [Armatimonadia bacterium]|nr:hypothetical protein [Armatimonadia bacterium]